jgi:predicted lipoprotein with Yx(FWY)xxD motif
MHSRLVLLCGFAAGAFIAAACGPATGSYGAGPATTPSSPPSTAPVAVSPSATASPQATGAAIAVGSSRLGSILVDSSGRTLYLFVADSGTASTCNSASCVQNWPPFLTNGAPQALSGVNASLLGTTKRGDGTEEVTYAGHPLYYFIADKKPGDITGQNIDAFGGPWYVVSPTGVQIR